MAQVVVPFVSGMLHPETQRVVLGCGWPTTWHCMDAADTGAYARLVERMWGRHEAFVIVEQDVVPPAGAIDELIYCPWSWCSHCYDDPSYQRAPMLGLCKFDGVLGVQLPEVATSVLRDSHHHRDPVHWRQLNEVLTAHLFHRRVPWHRHAPDAVHHHREPAAAG